MKADLTTTNFLGGAMNRVTAVNVLLVDDNAFARSVGRRVLQSAGVGTIQLATGGREALELLSRPGHGIDVVFCDLMMPDMDGVQIVRQMEILDRRPAIVFVSAAYASLLNMVEATANARGLCVLGSIQKPLTLKSVQHVLARFETAMASADAPPVAIELTPEDLDRALEQKQLLLHFQPKVSLADQSVAGFESLVRWQHPDKGLIPPGAFISFAEECGRIGALTDQVMTLALTQYAAWAESGLKTKISVNLSAYMLVDLDLPDRLAREVEHYRIDPGQIILEITESGLFQDAANALDILARLHMKGFPLSIDDFGTGYSSMEQLRRIPFSEMKIDRAFVNGAADKPKVRAILESSAALGRSLQMSVVAEGAETQEDWDLVRQAGVTLVQGYFVARPMPADRVVGWLTDWSQAHPDDARVG